MPREFLKAMSMPTVRRWRPPCSISEFEMVIPGSEIPEWFQHQGETSSIKIEKPLDSCDNKMVGYAVCCVFEVYEHQPTLSEGSYMSTHGIYCTVTNILRGGERRICFEENSGKAVSDHLWLFYFSAKEVYQDFVELSFAAGGPGSKVKKRGIHPIDEKELKELKPRAKKSSSSSFWNSYELDEDFLEDEIYFSADDELS
ncbi:uncharacterized protein LOC116145547 [Pistacia vera]|uniref:uncharacterized protein LOC116145547 n=1 Tax=Pistacia vera TaxID=55513 RepID=UPI001263B41A|nr:uncharacterized protein LOC116145547 [Pistacia vera]